VKAISSPQHRKDQTRKKSFDRGSSEQASPLKIVTCYYV
jgi:hypothetical protein